MRAYFASAKVKPWLQDSVAELEVLVFESSQQGFVYKTGHCPGIQSPQSSPGLRATPELAELAIVLLIIGSSLTPKSLRMC